MYVCVYFFPSYNKHVQWFFPHMLIVVDSQRTVTSIFSRGLRGLGLCNGTLPFWRPQQAENLDCRQYASQLQQTKHGGNMDGLVATFWKITGDDVCVCVFCCWLKPKTDLGARQFFNIIQDYSTKLHTGIHIILYLFSGSSVEIGIFSSRHNAVIILGADNSMN